MSEPTLTEADRARALADVLIQDLRDQRDRARAEAVAATTRHDDLRARIEALAEAWEGFAASKADPYAGQSQRAATVGALCRSHADELRDALDGAP